MNAEGKNSTTGIGSYATHVRGYRRYTAHCRSSVIDVGSDAFVSCFEHEILNGLVQHGGATCRFFEGSYGAGKTHLLRLLGETARARGIKRMIGNTVVDRPYDFVGSLAGNAIIAQLAGLRGLVVTIDEFEVEQSQLALSRLYRVQQLLTAIHAYL